MIMSQPVEWDFSLDDFKAWIKKNGRHLTQTGFDVTEIAFLAIHDCHFKREHVYDVLGHFEDACRGSSFENKMKMQMDRYQYTIDKMNGKVFLDQHWRDLVKKVSQGRDWDE